MSNYVRLAFESLKLKVPPSALIFIEFFLNLLKLFYLKIGMQCKFYGAKLDLPKHFFQLGTFNKINL